MTTPTEPATAPAQVPVLGNTPAAPMNPGDRRRDEFEDYPRDPWDRPLIAVLDAAGNPIPNPITGMTDRRGTPIPWVSEAHIRASTGGSALEHEGAINSWRVRQAVIGFMARPDLFALAKTIEDPGADGRSELDGRIKEAQTVAGSGAAANEGTARHAFAEKLDRGLVMPALDEGTTGWLEAYAKLTAGWLWTHIEARLVCRALRMAGRTDRIGRPPGYMIAPDGQIIGPDDLITVDLKTSSSSRYFGVKFAVQLAVYGHGELYDPATGRSVHTGARRDWALVLHIPSGATSGDWWWVNIAAGFELAQLANTVLEARKRKDIVAMVGTVYATLDEALAAGGVLTMLGESYTAADAEFGTYGPTDAERAPVLAEAVGVPISEASCEIHGEHGGTVDCIDCLEQWKAGAAPNGAMVEEFDHWRDRQISAHRARQLAVTQGMLTPQAVAEAYDVPVSMVEAGDRLAESLEKHGIPMVTGDIVEDMRLARAGHPAAQRPEPSDPTTWSPTVGKDLQVAHQARQDPEVQRQREILAVATAPPRGGLEAVRQRFALSWSPEHEAAAERRGWELGVLAALGRAQDVAGLLAVHAQVSAWGAWTDEMDRVANRHAAEMKRAEG